MKRFFFLLLKPFSFLPALAVMYLIFTFSAQTGDISSDLSYQVSHKIVTVGDQILSTGFSEDKIEVYTEKIHGPVRKLAHMGEYFLLAVAISFPLYVYGLRGFPLVLLAGALCVGFAFLDEYHQSFVSGRGNSVRDVMIDSIGIFLGITVVRIVCWTALAPSRFMEKRRQRKRRKKKKKK
jgi:VanZ family protein